MSAAILLCCVIILFKFVVIMNPSSDILANRYRAAMDVLKFVLKLVVSTENLAFL